MSSDEFYESFCSSGSAVITCTCGRTYYDGTCGDIEDDEFKQLQNDPKAQDVGDMTSWFMWRGHHIVFDCECGAAKAIEGVLWDNRRSIVNYLKKRTENNRKAQEMDESLLSGL